MVREEKQILEEINSKADSQYKQFQSNLCPNVNNILGVRIPDLRKYAKTLGDEDWKKTYKNIPDELYEGKMLKAMLIGLVKRDKNEKIEDYLDEKIKYIREFIPKIDSWAVCDIFCSSLKFIEQNKEIFWKFIQEYLQSNKEFEVRFAIVILLDYFITDEYIDEVIKKLDNIKTTHYYYVRMAVAWTISVAYTKFPDKIMKYLKNNNLDNETYNKSLQKIIESKRVSKKGKNIIRKMKK